MPHQKLPPTSRPPGPKEARRAAPQSAPSPSRLHLVTDTPPASTTGRAANRQERGTENSGKNSGEHAPGAAGQNWWQTIKRIWNEQPVLSYYLLLICTLLLVIIGVILVFSASTIQALENDRNPFLAFSRNAIITLVALCLMLVAARLPQRFYRRIAWVALLASWFLQFGIFTPLAKNVYGNTNWVMIPGINQVIQPSEFIKLALALYLGAILTHETRLADNKFASWLTWVGAPVVVSLGLVMAGKDLGTCMVIASLVMCSLFIYGIPAKVFIGIVFAGLTLAAAGVLSSPNRTRRVFGFMDASSSDPLNSGYQRKHGLWGLATGGLTGVGPGASREKWSYLPEASTDFIFAILGEEFGFIGCLVVLLLYTALAVAMFRIMRRSQSFFIQVSVAGFVGWIYSQTLINIGAVVGLLPIVGVPLPLLSSGGSAMLSTLLAIGVMLSFARCEPGAQDALGAKAGLIEKSLAVVTNTRRKRG